MFSKSLLAATAVAFFAVQAAAAPPVMTGDEVNAVINKDVARAAMIAQDSISACNCPNNCQHKLGSSCKFYKKGNVISATCQEKGDILECR